MRVPSISPALVNRSAWGAPPSVSMKKWWSANKDTWRPGEWKAKPQPERKAGGTVAADRAF